MTDADRKKENAVPMARVVCDTVATMLRHAEHIEQVCARYQDEPEFWAYLQGLGRTDAVTRARDIIRPIGMKTLNREVGHDADAVSPSDFRCKSAP